MRTFLRIALLLFVLFAFSACEQMGSTEYGFRFWKLPTAVGGGVSTRIYRPGEMVVDIPFVSKIYKFDTKVHDISWGERSTHPDPMRAEYVQTRALDGNELALAMTVSYKLTTNPEELLEVVRKVATSNEEIAELVIATARADIRTYMNELKTSEFISKQPRYRAVDRVKESMRERLGPFGIEVVQVILDDFKFRRLRKDGTFDSSYENRLKEIQQKREETERERARISTIVAKKEQELNDMQARVNQMIEEVKGFKTQSNVRGVAYLETKSNEAEAILAQGRAEVEGLIEKVNALSGPGGQAILKLELSRQLLKDNPRFVLMGESAGQDGIAVNRTDTNNLIDQIGLFEGLEAKKAGGPKEVGRPVFQKKGEEKK